MTVNYEPLEVGQHVHPIDDPAQYGNVVKVERLGWYHVEWYRAGVYLGRLVEAREDLLTCGACDDAEVCVGRSADA